MLSPSRILKIWKYRYHAYKENWLITFALIVEFWKCIKCFRLYLHYIISFKKYEHHIKTSLTDTLQLFSLQIMELIKLFTIVYSYKYIYIERSTAFMFKNLFSNHVTLHFSEARYINWFLRIFLYSRILWWNKSFCKKICLFIDLICILTSLISVILVISDSSLSVNNIRTVNKIDIICWYCMY